MKSIFFKSVREDGSSLWAIDKYARKYEIGKRYTFSEKTPSHIFVVVKCNEYGSYKALFCEESIEQYDITDIPLDNHDLIYNKRPEGGIGSRVLICYGDIKVRHIPICDVTIDWNFNSHRSTYWDYRLTSVDFTVIGEILPTKKDKINDYKYDIVLKRDIE